MEKNNSTKRDKIKEELLRLREEMKSLLDQTESEVDPVQNGEECFWWEYVCETLLKMISAIGEMISDEE